MPHLERDRAIRPELLGTLALILAAACGGSGGIEPSGGGAPKPDPGRVEPPPLVPQPAAPELLLAGQELDNPLAGGALWAAAVADFDGDGAVDLFFADGGDGWFLWGPAGTAWRDRTAAGVDDITAVVASDFDGDGDLDLALSRSPSSTPKPGVLLRNDGGRTFTATTGNGWAVPLAATGIAALDADGDQDTDLIAVAGFSTTGNARLFLNDGAGEFADGTVNLPFDLSPRAAVAAADLDRDGDDDLVLLGDGRPSVWTNDGTGRFTVSTGAALPGAALDDGTAIVIADFDGDGDPDLAGLAASVGAGNLQIHSNDGTGRFTAATTPTVYATGLAAADADGDGDVDLACSGLQLLRNDGAGGFTDVTTAVEGLDVPNASTLWTWADVDRNGRPDLLFESGSFFGGPMIAFEVGGAYVSRFGPRGKHLETGVDRFALGDVDGDGDTDLLAGRCRPNLSGSCSGVYDIELHRNDGAGRFSLVASTPLTTPPGYLVVADLDGDGLGDLVTGSRWYRSAGSSIQAGGTPWPVVPGTVTDIRAFDADRDNDLDVLLAGDGGVVLLENEAGVFTADPSAGLPLQSAQFSEVFDPDGDGDADLVFVHPGAQTSLYLNDGTGRFTDATARLPRGTGVTNDIAAIDADLDGDEDLAVLGDRQLVVYDNDGAGAFTVGAVVFDDFAELGPTFGRTSRYLQRVDAMDLDLDGDRDLLIRHTTVQSGIGAGDRISFRFQDGAGQFFAPAPGWSGGNDSVTTFSTRGNADLAAADLDDDGDIDVVHGRVDLSVLRNQHRGFRSTDLAIAGSTYSLELTHEAGFAPVDRPAALLLGIGAAALPLPPLGTVRIDPTALFALPVQLAAPAGRATVALPLPRGPFGPGLQLHSQVLWVDAGGTALALSPPVIDTVVW